MTLSLNTSCNYELTTSGIYKPYKTYKFFSVLRALYGYDIIMLQRFLQNINNITGIQFL